MNSRKTRRSPVRTALLCACIMLILACVVVSCVLLLDKRRGQGDGTLQTAGTTQSPAAEPPAPATDPTEPAAPTEPDPTEPEPTEPEPTEPEPTEPEPTEPPFDGTGPADVTERLVKSGTVYIAGGAGYSVYFFNEKNATRYCDSVNRVAENVRGKAQVYSILCPISAGVNLSPELQASIGLSDEHEATEWFYDHMDESVRTVTIFPTLKKHNDEYLFFRTDHHWTALGAYYAYCEWCKVKGVEPHELSSFQTYTFEGYLGSFYNYSNKNSALAANKDTVVAYIPNGTNKMTMYMNNGGGYRETEWNIVKDVSGYGSGSYYGTFVAGDQPYNYAHNEAVTDGSSVLIVKDSYGNAFIPFLIDHYEHIYWIDYRSYKGWCTWAGYADTSISALVERREIQDVIFCQNLSIAGGSSAQADMEAIYK